MRNTVKRASVLYVLIVAFFIGLGFMLYGFIANGDSWAAYSVNEHLFKYRQLTTAGTVYDRDGKILAQTVDGKRTYNEDATVRKATLHAVGDSQGYIATGVQKVYRSELIGYSFVHGIYKTINSGKGSDITLTIDSDISTTALNALGNRKGTVGVYNYLTGEVVCMVSSPTYDPLNKPSDINTDTTGKYDGIYINRFLSGVFTPGSTFKIVTAISALENIPDIMNRTFNCQGSNPIDGGKVICHSTHGNLSFKNALSHSCNCAFSAIAVELGKEKLTQTVRDLGLGKNVVFGKNKSFRSTFDLSSATNLDLGWAGIGQFTTLVNPCQMMVLMGAIANNGTAIEPTLIKKMSGKLTLDLTDNVYSNITLAPETAQQIKTLLRANVTDYYKTKFDADLEMAGKTGTAEVSNGNPHAWFTGFSVNSALPYAVVVVIENGGSGSGEAIPVANKVMRAIADGQ